MKANLTASIDERLQVTQRDLLRFLTCGSVDDGKSTLIGRLLHDSHVVYDDQLDAVRRDTLRHGTTGEEIDFALLTDGLQAERDQGITIDVAYRYFATPRRKFIIADTPGHEQYTRNMATGASTCNLAIILVDAQAGVMDQTRRHAFIASLLGIEHIVVAVNKMDLVAYEQARFEDIRKEFAAFAAKLEVSDISFIPMSALRGENVVHRSLKMPWYLGGPLLEYLETVHVAGDLNLIDLRFPVQYVLRPDSTFRGYAGTIASGVMRKRQEVIVLPAGIRTRISSIVTFDGELEEAFAPMAVTVKLENEVDAARGDMLVPVNNLPHLQRDIEAMLVWMSSSPMSVGREYLLKQTTVQSPCVITDLRYRMNVNTLHREDAHTLLLNEIGRVRIDTPRLLAYDPYAANRATGAFILIDRTSNETVAGGMILHREPADTMNLLRRGAILEGSGISPEERARMFGQRPFLLSLTGNEARHRIEAAYALERMLFDDGLVVNVVPEDDAFQAALMIRLGIIAIMPAAFEADDSAGNVRRYAVHPGESSAVAAARIVSDLRRVGALVRENL